jgi:hypothetical protein
LLARIVEWKVELAPQVIVGGAGNKHAARVAELLEPRGDVDALAVAVLALDDHVAEIDAEPHVDALPVGEATVALRHAALKRYGAFHRIDHAAELGK